MFGYSCATLGPRQWTVPAGDGPLGRLRAASRRACGRACYTSVRVSEARELKGALASGSSPPATTGWIGVAPTGSAERELLLSIRRPRLAGWTTRNDELTARPAGTLSSLRFESTLFPEDRPQTNCFKGEHHIRAITLTFVDAPPVRFETQRGMSQCNHTQEVSFTSPITCIEGFRQSVFLQGLRVTEANGTVHNLGGTDASPPCNNARDGGLFVSFGVHAIDGAVIGGVANYDDYTMKGLKFALGAREAEGVRSAE